MNKYVVIEDYGDQGDTVHTYANKAALNRAIEKNCFSDPDQIYHIYQISKEFKLDKGKLKEVKWKLILRKRQMLYLVI